MKNKISIFLSISFLLCLSSIKSQNTIQQDSLISISNVKTFLISNPPPQYIIEIRNDQTISFYNILPENSRNYKSVLGSWIVDSTNLSLEEADFTKLMKTINGINLENIAKIEKPKSKNGIEPMMMGVAADKYSIVLTSKNVEFYIGPNNEKYISESAKIIRDLFKELENKYKPKE